MPRRSRRTRRDYARMRMRDMARSRRRNQDRARDYNYYGDSERYDRYDYPSSNYDYARRGRASQSDRQFGGDYGYPRDMTYYGIGMYSPDYGYDYARRRDYAGYYDYAGRHRRDYDSEESEYLSDDELMEWAKDLYQDVEQKDKMFFTKENMERRAAEMGIKFDKFSFEEFYTTALMMYTDYCDTLGTNNMDIYLRLAKDWLCDEDAELQYGEKLSAYHDYIVMGE